jgi:DNA-binding MarR family transcriptional regulator
MKITDLINALKKFNAVDQEIPIAQMLLLLEVAQAGESGTSLTEIASKHGMGQANASRNLAQLGKSNRKHVAGYQLIDAIENPMDRRFKILTLTNNGKLFMKDLLRED